MRTILRAILSVALLLGSGLIDWTPAGAQVAPHECCCCGDAAGMGDTCPCPKPESNRGPQRGACTERQTVVALKATRSEQGQRRTEARPEPASWAIASTDGDPGPAITDPTGGRDPDLGRHLARLSAFRI